jgi:DNA-binding response OmpR family regulator
MKKILIIEDDLVLLDLLKEKLNRAGYEIASVTDGNLAIKEIESFKPDLILLDMVLPGISGIELLERFHKDLSIKSIPVIIVSNSGQPIEIEKALKLGVKDYLIKTEFSPEDILEKVDKIFSNRKEINETQERAERKNIDEVQKEKQSREMISVLIVEDDKFLKDLLSQKLQKEGMKVIEATDGETALSLVKKEMPRIILLDLILPSISGFEVLEKIKNDPEISFIPVVVLSNLGEEKDKRKSLELGAKKFLVKAEHTASEILDEIRKVLTTSYAP